MTNAQVALIAAAEVTIRGAFDADNMVMRRADRFLTWLGQQTELPAVVSEQPDGERPAWAQPDTATAVAETLLYVAVMLDGADALDLTEAANTVADVDGWGERCPLCQETVCGQGCPLRRVR
jgi:hypothetical protein